MDQVDEAASLVREQGAQAVIAIGGGSPIDATKSVAVLLGLPG
ncbi:iron-containing alcohol dehydrogenase [Moorella naiadis]